eukprot:11315160-Ditylum_brightwellii.AAC.1
MEESMKMYRSKRGMWHQDQHKMPRESHVIMGEQCGKLEPGYEPEEPLSRKPKEPPRIEPREQPCIDQREKLN